MKTWPSLPYDDWPDTIAALHLYTQIVGKYRLARTPWANHSWHVPLHVHVSGLTTGVVHDGDLGVEVVFDFRASRLMIASSQGETEFVKLEPMSVAAFHDAFRSALKRIGANPDFHGSPNEVPDPVPFEKDKVQRPYDAAAVQRFGQALLRIEKVFYHFRTGFIGKVSPINFYWGSFDLAVTRFSGRTAPEHPGGFPALPDAVTREAYSHEVSSAGFWPGNASHPEPAFFSYAYPAPEGFGEARIGPGEASFDSGLGEFLLPYNAVAEAENPDALLLDFLQDTYEAAANLGNWSRSEVECALGEPGIPRALP